MSKQAIKKMEESGNDPQISNILLHDDTAQIIPTNKWLAGKLDDLVQNLNLG
ncbi:MAG: hypothetical protein J6X70_01455 [Muribaculaceae bacterium]|nr:hypothetical protein [Muribaculaceae bacterium]